MLKLSILMIFVFSIAGCASIDPNRDMIVFDGKESAVRDSIVEMNTLMEKMPSPASETRLKSWFFIDKNIIDINGSRYNIDTTILSQYEILNSFDDATKARFINLVRYFQLNHLTSCREDYSVAELSNEYYYTYRFISSDWANSRNIFLYKPEYIQRYNDRAFIKILDVKNGLVLISYLDPPIDPISPKDLWKDTSDRLQIRIRK